MNELENKITETMIKLQGDGWTKTNILDRIISSYGVHVPGLRIEELYENLPKNTDRDLTAREKSQIQRELSKVEKISDVVALRDKLSNAGSNEAPKEPANGIDGKNITTILDGLETGFHAGYTTLFPLIDIELGGGMERGQHTVIVGTTNGGKSMLALSLSMEYILKNNLKVMYLNAEDESKNIVRRIIAYFSNIKNKDIKHGIDHMAISGLLDRFEKGKLLVKDLFTNDRFTLRPFGLDEIQGALNLIENSDHDVVIIENLDCLVDGSGERMDMKIAKVIEKLNNIAKNKNKLIISLHQAGSKANAIVEDTSTPISVAISKINLENCVAESHYAVQAKIHTLLFFGFRQEDPSVTGDKFNGYSAMKIMKQKNGAKYIHEELYADLNVSKVVADNQQEIAWFVAQREEESKTQRDSHKSTKGAI